MTEASMGVDAADFDNDGDEDLFMTHLNAPGEQPVRQRRGRARSPIGAPVRGSAPAASAYTGWGTTWFDFDNDGWLDLLVVNGTITALPGRPAGAVSLRSAQDAVPQPG